MAGTMKDLRFDRHRKQRTSAKVSNKANSYVRSVTTGALKRRHDAEGEKQQLSREGRGKSLKGRGTAICAQGADDGSARMSAARLTRVGQAPTLSTDCQQNVVPVLIQVPAAARAFPTSCKQVVHGTRSVNYIRQILPPNSPHIGYRGRIPTCSAKRARARTVAHSRFAPNKFRT